MYQIVSKKSLNPTVTQMEIYAPFVAKKALAGQFIILRVDADGERIPLTVADYDREKGTVAIIFQIVGGTTERLNQKNEGDFIPDFVGPLGRPTHTDGLKKVCVVGGGVGCAIALPVAKALHEQGCEVTSIIGFRNKDLVILEDEFKACSTNFNMMTDDGSYGRQGNVCVPLKELLEKGELTKKEILVGRFREFFEIIGADVSIAEDFNMDYQLTLGDYIQFVDKAKDILLSQKGRYVIAAATNGTKVAQEKKLRLSGLNEIFDEIFISEDIGAEKPSKEFFDFVFDKLGITDKSEVIIIGDSLTGDIKGGFCAGIDTCWFNPHCQTAAYTSKYEIKSLQELKEIL